MFHRNAGPVPDTFRNLCRILEQQGLDYVVIGAFALSAHHYPRATSDVDLCMRPADIERFRKKLVGETYHLVQGFNRRFHDPNTDVTIDLLPSGSLAGRVSRNPVVRFPDPDEAKEIAGMRTIDLPRLIELKLVTWRHRDWSDVIELIRANNLNEEFAQNIDPLVRMAYLECYDHKVDEDRYEQEAGGH